MSFSDGFKKQAFIGTIVGAAARPLARAGMSLGKKLVKIQGGKFNAGMNAMQVVGDTGSYRQKFKSAERGVSGIG